MHTEEGWLTLSLAIPQEALNRAIQEQREAIQAAVMSRLPVAITPPAAPNRPRSLQRRSRAKWSPIRPPIPR